MAAVRTMVWGWIDVAADQRFASIGAAVTATIGACVLISTTNVRLVVGVMVVLGVAGSHGRSLPFLRGSSKYSAKTRCG